MNTIEAIILGVVEGITEFLPISSTAHLDIGRLALGIPLSEFVKSFMITIQFGAILAVVFLYRKNIFGNYKYVRNILIAFIPTGILGFILYKIIKSVLIGNTMLAATMLILGGVLILILERRTKVTPTPEGVGVPTDNVGVENIPIKKLLVLGVAQAVAVIPGVSRSLAVILAGRMLAIPKVTITEFSFLLAIPTMLSATLYDLYKSGFSFSGGDWGILALGFMVSAVVAFFVVKWLINYIKNHSFAIFGWYRIIFGVLVLIFLLF